MRSTKRKQFQNHFKARCKSLAAIDFSCFVSLISIGSGFLEECSTRTSVDLTPLWWHWKFAKEASCATLVDNFMAGCSSLISTNASSLVGVAGCGGHKEVWGLSQEFSARRDDERLPA